MKKLYDWLVGLFPEIKKEEIGKKWLARRRQDIMDLADRSALYLRRFILFRTPWRGSYLHHIVRSDNDRCAHDHPWDFDSLILWGGYYEETFTYPVGDPRNDDPTTRTLTWYGPGSFRRMKATHIHRVLLKKRPDGTEIPAWTLVTISGKKRSWGFWQRGKWVPWRTFIAGDREC